MIFDGETPPLQKVNFQLYTWNRAYLIQTMPGINAITDTMSSEESRAQSSVIVR